MIDLFQFLRRNFALNTLLNNQSFGFNVGVRAALSWLNKVVNWCFQWLSVMGRTSLFCLNEIRNLINEIRNLNLFSVILETAIISPSNTAILS